MNEPDLANLFCPKCKSDLVLLWYDEDHENFEAHLGCNECDYSKRVLGSQTLTIKEIQDHMDKEIDLDWRLKQVLKNDKSHTRSLSE